MHPFPLVRSGGMFVFFIGSGIVIGAIIGEKYLVLPLIMGAVLAVSSQIIWGQSMTASLGVPSRLQITALVSAIVLESISLGVVGSVLSAYSLRVLLLWVLVVVAVHFFLIAVAEGPLLIVLGGLCLLNAVAGLRLSYTPLLIYWLADGVLKIAFGILMFRTRPLTTGTSP